MTVTQGYFWGEAGQDAVLGVLALVLYALWGR
jgi:hypothetical protein